MKKIHMIISLGAEKAFEWTQFEFQEDWIL